MRTLYVDGTGMAQWPGVSVWQSDGGGDFENISNTWTWAPGLHQHYEVQALDTGSYWVQVSTHLPHSWDSATLVEGSRPAGRHPVNPARTEYRASGTYIWIPNDAIPDDLVPGITTNRVICNPPAQAPALNFQAPQVKVAAQLVGAHALLDELLAAPSADQAAFKDSDGLISFVNLSSSFVTSNSEFKTGRQVCDKVANFFATLRVKVFQFLQGDPSRVLPSDTPPTTKWDPAVTHYMQFLLSQAGGLTGFKVTTETYSVTQVLTEFNTAFLKLFFDAATVPGNILTDVSNFIQGVGTSLRASWDNRARNYQTALLGQCHEAVPTDSSETTTVYFPKIKYYYLSVDSSQTAFTSPCTSVEKITFNFKYEYYVTALKASLLDTESKDYAAFVGFLDKAQGISYKQAMNNLDAILGNTVSSPGGSPVSATQGGISHPFGINLESTR